MVREKSREFSQAIADNAGRFKEFGFSVDSIVDTYEDLFKTYKTNITISDEELLQLKATSSVTNQTVETLAGAFRNVGIGINEVGDRMLEVTNIAKDAGVAVSSVASGVVSNMDKMNKYNFEGGIKGLAKMSAQASRLDIDMSKIFGVVDKVFNPEGAIELAASLQRLGVSANGLLDPLRLMDLSQNDPAELQNQIVNMSKEFVRFNKELGQFEIMPGEKRRLNEIGTALGMTNGELQKMALNAAGLDFKMKQIKFPSSIASKEDRELIATLATVNKEGVAEIKVKRFDEKGDFTGQYDIVDASQLTTDQLKAIKEDQQSRGLTMEELQKESLTEEQRTNYLLQSILTAVAYGESGSAPALDLYDFVFKKARTTFFQEEGREGGLIPKEVRDSKQYRTTFDDLYKTAKESELIKEVGPKVLEFLKTEAEGIFDDLDLGGVLDNVMNSSSDLLKGIGLPDLTKIIPGFGGSTNDPFTIYNQKITEAKTNLQTQNTNIINNNPNKIDFNPLQILEEIKVDLNVKLDPDSKNQALTQLMTQALEEFFTGGQNKQNVDIIKTELEKQQTFQGLLSMAMGKKSLISAPGKD